MTAQIPDRIYCDDPCPWGKPAGDAEPLCSNPLQGWLAHHPVDFGPGGSTALWRGYIATWRIRSQRLWLENVSGKKLASMFGDDPERVVEPDGLVLADWTTLEMRVPVGRQTQYVHMGYASQYEHDRLIQVQDGRIVLYELVDTQKDKQLSLQIERETVRSIAPPEYWPFLESIFQEPACPNRRAIFADWLEEHSDPLAPLLRLVETDEQRRLSEREKAIVRSQQLAEVLGRAPLEDPQLLALSQSQFDAADDPEVNLYEVVLATLSAAARKRRDRRSYLERLRLLSTTQYSLLRCLGLLPPHHLIAWGWNERNSHQG